GTPIQSAHRGRPSCLDRVGSAKRILFRADIDRAERSSWANIRIHRDMGWIQSSGSRPFKPAAGTSLLRQSAVTALVRRYQQRRGFRPKEGSRLKEKVKP